MNTPEYWIEKLNLQPHPEGGYFKENYRSDESIPKSGLPERFDGSRDFSTAIYFLLNKTDVSAFHRIKQDEIWHFYYGSSLTIHVIDKNGDYRACNLGLDLTKGQSPQIAVDAGAYFAAEVDDKSSFPFVGCTVAPGFDFADFEMPDQKELLRIFPDYAGIVKRLSK